MKKFQLVGAYLGLALACLPLAVQAKTATRIPFRNQALFLSGGNVGWINFAHDVDPNVTNPQEFDKIFADVQKHGGNSVRLWVHTNGASSPQYSGDSVQGPGSGTISALQKIVDLAWSHKVTLVLCLWSFDMENPKEISAQQLRRNTKLLTDTRYTNNYINHALIPMVKGLKGHPGVVTWEIFNEPGGMTKEFGFNGTIPVENRVSMHDIQRTVNLMAGAIHRADPDAKVTNGSVSLIQNTDVNLASGDHNFNYYRDDRLKAAGGDVQGTLDFYTVHYYSWMHASITPLLHDVTVWQLDKPLVIGEFFIKQNGVNQTAGVDPAKVYETLYQRGYAGAFVWDWSDYHTNRQGLAENWPLGLSNMDYIKAHHSWSVTLRSSGSSGSPASPAFSLAPAGKSLSVTQGHSVSDTISVAGSGGFNGSVTLTVHGLPVGVTASIAPNPTMTSSVLTLSAGIAASTGASSVTIDGRSGALTASSDISLNVDRSGSGGNSGAKCAVKYSILPYNSKDFGGRITITNTGSTTFNDWTLIWNFANGQSVFDLWNGTKTQSGSTVTVHSLGFNGTLPAGTSYDGVGFNSNWNGSSNAVPKSFSLNGTACSVN